MKKISIALLLSFCISTVVSQAQPCNQSLSISTPTNWLLTSMSPAATLPSSYNDAPSSIYVSWSSGNWLGLNFPASSTHYTFTRTFYVCKEGDYYINFNAAADNILNVSVDGAAPFFTDNAPGQSAFNQFYPGSTTVHLTCGKHIITADVYNFLNYMGFVLQGNISTINGCLNNTDCDCIVTNPCCKNAFPFWSEVDIPQSYAYDEGTYSIENFVVKGANTTPITEIKATVENFELLSKYEDCKKCYNKPSTLGSIFGIKIIGSGSNMLTVQTQPYGTGVSNYFNNNEVVWQNSNGVTLNAGDKIGLVYILPSEKDLPCCVDSAKICIRFSYRDINCGYCEVENCSTIPLRAKKDLPVAVRPNLLMLYLNSKNIYTTGRAPGL